MNEPEAVPLAGMVAGTEAVGVAEGGLQLLEGLRDTLREIVRL